MQRFTTFQRETLVNNKFLSLKASAWSCMDSNEKAQSNKTNSNAPVWNEYSFLPYPFCPKTQISSQVKFYII